MLFKNVIKKDNDAKLRTADLVTRYIKPIVC